MVVPALPALFPCADLHGLQDKAIGDEGPARRAVVGYQLSNRIILLIAPPPTVEERGRGSETSERTSSTASGATCTRPFWQAPREDLTEAFDVSLAKPVIQTMVPLGTGVTAQKFLQSHRLARCFTPWLPRLRSEGLRGERGSTSLMVVRDGNPNLEFQAAVVDDKVPLLQVSVAASSRGIFMNEGTWKSLSGALVRFCRCGATFKRAHPTGVGATLSVHFVRAA